MTTRSIYNPLTGILLRLMALQFNYRPSLNRYLKSTDGWINFAVGFRTERGTVEKAIIFCDGRVSVSGHIPSDVDVVMRFVSDATLKEMLGITPNEMLNLIMTNKMILDGNMTYLQLFNFYVSLLLGKKHQKMLEKAYREDTKSRKREYFIDNRELSKELTARKKYRMKGEKEDAGVKFLEDPYLSRYSLDDFPRLGRLRDVHFEVMPELCAERPKLLTEWYRTHGFECDVKGNPWVPELRQAHAFKYLMEERKPIIAEDSLIAGTSTSKEPTGVLIYPDSSGTLVWGELETIEKRILNPYRVSKEDAEILHDVFSFWAKRNFKQWVREKYEKPLCLQIDERWVYYFVWKSVGISHTIPDYPRVLQKGMGGIIGDIEERLKRDDNLDEQKRNALKSMALCLEGVNDYAKNLSREAERRAEKEANPERKRELLRLAEICEKVPKKPAETLDEAVNVVWIVWVALHMENTNTGLSFGRLDQWLQPYFESDMRKLSSDEERRDYIEKAIELVGCLYMRGTDHLPLVPDISGE
jgi:hypothetical protein